MCVRGVLTFFSRYLLTARMRSERASMAPGVLMLSRNAWSTVIWVDTMRLCSSKSSACGFPGGRKGRKGRIGCRGASSVGGRGHEQHLVVS